MLLEITTERAEEKESTLSIPVLLPIPSAYYFENMKYHNFLDDNYVKTLHNNADPKKIVEELSNIIYYQLTQERLSKVVLSSFYSILTICCYQSFAEKALPSLEIRVNSC